MGTYGFLLTRSNEINYIVNLIPPRGGCLGKFFGRSGAVDWMTLCIEAVGAAILCIWIVVPVTEFNEILAKVRPRALHDEEAARRKGRDG